VAPAGLTGTAEAVVSVEQVPSADGASQPPAVIESIDVGGIDARSAALLLSGQQSGDVAGAVAWVLGPLGEDGLQDLPYVVEVDGASLIDGLPGPRIAIGIFTYAIDDEGHIASRTTDGVVLESQASGPRIAENGLRFFGKADLAPGSYTLRVLIRARGSNRFFLSQSPVVVPLPNEIRQDVLNSVFPEPGGTWVSIRQPGAGTEILVNGGHSIVPAARPVLLEGRTTDFYVGGAGIVAPAIDASLLDSTGQVRAEIPVEVSEVHDPTARLRLATLPVVDLPAGLYTLNLETRGRDAQAEARQSMTVALVENGGPRSWLHRSDQAEVVGNSDFEPHSGGATRFRRKQARASYVGALKTLATGDAASARQLVMKLERTANSNGHLRSLRRVEDAVAAQLAGENPASLLPIALLHQQLVRRYSARYEFVLASFSRSTAAGLAEDIDSDGEDGRFAAALLVNLASDLARTASATLAVEYLQSALAADPTSLAALLALGAISEREADYKEAVANFSRLVDYHPDFAEGRLRLAVNLVRLGHERAAEEQFDILLGLQSPAWIEAVGAQEYARMLIDQDRRDEATEALETAIDRRPEDQRLRILAAYSADSEGRWLEAVEAILQIPPAGDGISPRTRYTEWPDLGRAVSAGSLRAAATSALPALADALETVDGLK
jgi:tetratricopeptide (TPR) repeat protein